MIYHKIYTSAAAIPESWDGLALGDTLLQRPYLKALEAAAPKNISLYFVGIFKNEILVGLAVIQRVELYLKDMFRDHKVSCFKTLLKDLISKILKGNVLVVGNLTHTGQHGMHFNTKQLSHSEFYNALFKAIAKLKLQIAEVHRKTIRIVMLKDFFQNDGLLHPDFFQKEALHKVSVQPNMVMPIRGDWHTPAAYVAAMTKKYRTRYKRAKKKLNGITCQDMDLNAIKTHTKRLHHLYLNVSNTATFNTFILPEHHFYMYKLHLKDAFKVFGYYLKGELIGFFTLIGNGKTLETYFLGYATAHQHTNQLYLNMLYDMAAYAIEHGFSSVVYARTAMEIKSSVGAQAEPMQLYMKHTNRVLNGILKYVFKFMNPQKEWQERHPFG